MVNKTVTVGIPAFNEEKGIMNLIDNLLFQKQVSCSLEKIIVNDDGSSDRTKELIQAHPQYNKKIFLLSDGKRLGQAARLNQLIKLNKSDIFVTIDADSLPKNDTLIEEIVNAFGSNQKIGLVAGNDQPDSPNTIVGQIIKTGIDLWYEVRKNLNNGDTVQNCHGCILAFSKDFAKQLEIPTNMFGFDEFIYFSNKKLGFDFKKTQDAVVYYKTAGNLKDFFKQNSRYIQTEEIMTKHFGKGIYDGQKPNIKQKLRAIYKIFWRSPIYLILSVFLQISLRVFKPLFVENSKSGRWTVIGKSTS